jgi:hypothetical protein
MRAWLAAAAAARRDRTFFCIVGTLLAMGVVVYQGDYSGYEAALAARAAKAAPAQASTLASLAPAGTQVGYRTTPASGDPYRWCERCGARCGAGLRRLVCMRASVPVRVPRGLP